MRGLLAVVGQRGLSAGTLLIAAGGLTLYQMTSLVLGPAGSRELHLSLAIPAVDAAGLVSEIPQLAAVPELEAETLMSLPGPHLSLRQALEIARRAADAAERGEGVVITTGTDTMEELAVACAMLHGSEAPIVLTGANRPGSAPGADGAANLIDAVALAGSSAAGGLGVVVVFGGEVHAAMTVRKVDSRRSHSPPAAATKMAARPPSQGPTSRL